MSEEADLGQMVDDWPRMRVEIASLKSDVRELIHLVKLLDAFKNRQMTSTIADGSSKELRRRIDAILKKRAISKQS
jgi:hypothetical protein